MTASKARTRQRPAASAAARPKDAGPRCGNELCTCQETPVQSDGTGYCSAECASPEARRAGACLCGHDECKHEGLHREVVPESAARPTVDPVLPATLTPPLPPPV